MTPELTAWRKATRLDLLAKRMTMSSAEREEWTAALWDRLDALVAARAAGSIGLYWPIKGEIDLRGWAARLPAERGYRFGLPVVVEPKTPLVYRLWHPGAAMTRGFWNIPVPVDPAEIEPDIVIAPLVGFDAAGYRLGYGGGYFDRTLAARKTRPYVIGLGLDAAELATITPCPHDIPMSVIVTPTRTLPRAGA